MRGLSNQSERRFFRLCFCCCPAPSVSPKIHRRSVISGIVAIGLGASASVITRTTPGACGAETRGKAIIDRCAQSDGAPFYLAENRERIAGSRGGQISAAWLDWEPQKALEAMDEHGVATAVLYLICSFCGSFTAASKQANELCTLQPKKNATYWGAIGKLVQGHLLAFGCSANYHIRY
jgi:6-methylsalicylate decarboxylase